MPTDQPVAGPVTWDHYAAVEAFLTILGNIPDDVEDGMDAGVAIAVAQLQATLALVDAINELRGSLVEALEADHG